MKLFQLFFGLLIVLFLKAGPVFAQEVPFNRGINLTGWFQASNPQQIQLGKYTLEDFQQIKSLGCDVIRLPINLHAMAGNAPNYRLDPLFLDFLDQAVDWAESLEIYLILDNHTFDPAEDTDPNIGGILTKVWTQMAEHYQNRSEYVMYEILNEPHGISDQLWNSIQMEVVDAIREIDQDHYIVIGPAGWNSFHNLDAMPVYPQEKLIYTFHFYDPFIFTHQGASWTDPSMAPLSDVPFPHSASEMPTLPGSLAGTWIESAFNDYHNTGSMSNVQAMIDIAVEFQQQRNVPIYCGEFGAYIPNSNPQDRVDYYQLVRTYLEQQGIAWTMWDYHGGFGLFRAGGNGLFEHDLNVELLEALSFNTPEQTPFVKQPESSGFPVYTDQIGKGLQEASSSGNGLINYYAQDNPNNGTYCIRWENAQRYRNIGLDVQPNKDLSQLEAQNYAVDFIFRGSSEFSFDLRFTDTDTGPDDHPWRMNYTINESVVTYDRRWHHLHIPLSDFQEGGAWEGTFFPAEGKFDWTAIDRFEIVAEHQDMNDAQIWFDNLIITNLDTARVQDNSVFELVTSIDEPDLSPDFRIYPNPVDHELMVEDLRSQPGVPTKTVLLRDAMGRLIKSHTFNDLLIVDTSALATGFYHLQIYQGDQVFYTGSLIKNR